MYAQGPDHHVDDEDEPRAHVERAGLEEVALHNMLERGQEPAQSYVQAHRTPPAALRCRRVLNMRQRERPGGDDAQQSPILRTDQVTCGGDIRRSQALSDGDVHAGALTITTQ